MNYLLFQPASLSEPDKVYFNGKLVEDISKRRKVYDKIVSLFNDVGINSYPWFGRDGDYFVLRGLFDAKDEKGRTLSFLFASDSSNYEVDLKNLSKTIGYNVDAQTLASIDNFINRPAKKKSIIKYVSLAIVGIVLLITLIALLCNTHQTY